MNGILNWILWMPIIGMIGVLLTPKTKENAIRYVTLATTFITLVLTIVLWCNFDNAATSMQFTVKFPWIESFNIYYSLGVDGLTLPMTILNGLLFFLCTLSSWTVEKSVKSYFALILMLQSTVFGVFFSLDFFLFYVYWEVMLLPMFFLIGIWGGENREYAAIKFFLYTFFGSIFMLVGIIALYYATGKGVDSFNILAHQGGKFVNETVTIFGHSFSFEHLFFWFMFLGFAIKVPVFPFHTWLPHAHVQAQLRFLSSSRVFYLKWVHTDS